MSLELPHSVSSKPQACIFFGMPRTSGCVDIQLPEIGQAQRHGQRSPSCISAASRAAAASCVPSVRPHLRAPLSTTDSASFSAAPAAISPDRVTHDAVCQERQHANSIVSASAPPTPQASLQRLQPSPMAMSPLMLFVRRDSMHGLLCPSARPSAPPTPPASPQRLQPSALTESPMMLFVRRDSMQILLCPPQHHRLRKLLCSVCSHHPWQCHP